MNWQKIWLVARREYLFNFKRPAFLILAFGLPLFSFGAMFLLTRFIVTRESNLDDWQRVAYIDRAAIMSESVVIPADCDHHYIPVIHPDLTLPATGDPAALDAYYADLQSYATQQVQDNQLDAFFVVHENYALNGQIDLFADKNVPEALYDNVNSFMWHHVSSHAPDNLAVPVDRLGNNDYTIRDLESGKALSEAEMAGRFLLPFIFIMIYLMATNTTGQFLMSGVVEEKENRLMEILATSLKPLDLLWGKLLGLSALALTQVALWATASVLFAAFNNTAQELFSGADFQTGDIILIVGLFLINFLLFAAAMLGIGASVTAETESRQIAGFFTIISMLPLMLLVTFITNPDGPVPQFFTFFPLTAAVALILRLGLTTLPMWQVALSVAIQAVTVITVMWLAAKAFRLGMLMYGKRLTPRTLWQALREGRTTLTTASTEHEAASGKAKDKKKKRWGLL